MTGAEALACGEEVGAAVRCEHGGLQDVSEKLGEVSQLPMLVWWEGWEEKGLQTLQERGWEEASRPAAQSSPKARSCLRRADTSKAWKGSRPRKQAFQMNSTHRNRKQDTI